MDVDEPTLLEQDAEFKAVTAALNAFYKFYTWQYGRVVRPKSVRLNSLTTEEQQYLSWFPELIAQLKERALANRTVTEEIAMIAAQDWGITTSQLDWEEPRDVDYDKVRATLLQFAREWSSEGVDERLKTIDRIVAKVCDLYPNPKQRALTKVLVPGCGLGRQVYELSRKGFWTQGNEVSYSMLMALSYILNSLKEPESRKIYPYLHKSTNLALRKLQLRAVSIPDVSSFKELMNTDLSPEGVDLSQLMSMTAGSFVDLYGPSELSSSDEFTDDPAAVQFRAENLKAFDVVATCFFVDTAHNIIDYLKTIRNVLKEGGVWINIGPLHWHFEGDQTTRVVKRADMEGQIATSVPVIMEGMELTREELFGLMDSMGFEFLEQESGIQTTYGSDNAALSNFVYGCEFWVAKLR